MKVKTLLISLVLLIPVVVYFRLLDYYAINIPKWDDHALKMFLEDYSRAQTFWDRLGILFKQHNEHRIALTRWISWLDYSLFGKLNYRHLMLFGNFLLLGIPLLWWRILSVNRKPLYTLLPVPFLWLTLAHWENMYWGMASIQNFGVVTFVAWTIYFLAAKGRLKFGMALIAAGFALITSGNGLLVVLIGLVMLALSRSYHRLVVWGVFSVFSLVLYFTNYTKVPYNPESKASLPELLKGYMAFLGAFAESFPVKGHFEITIWLGTILFLVAISIVLTCLLRILRNQYETKEGKTNDLFCLGILLFVLGTAAIVVYGRAGFGLEGLITSRYKIYSLLLVMTGFLYVVIPIRGSFLSPYVSGITFFCLVYSLVSYHYHLIDAQQLRKYLTTREFNSTFMLKEPVMLVDTSFAAGLVEKTPVFYSPWLPLIKVADKQGFAGETRGLSELFKNTVIQTEKEHLEIRNTSYKGQNLRDGGIYVLLSSSKRNYLFPALRERNTGRKQLFLERKYFADGFQLSIPFMEVDSGRYAVGLVSYSDIGTGLFFGSDSVVVRPVKSEKINTNW